MRILFAEDDAELRTRLTPDLKAAGFAVDRADDGVDAEFMGDEVQYDAVILYLVSLPRTPSGGSGGAVHSPTGRVLDLAGK